MIEQATEREMTLEEKVDRLADKMDEFIALANEIKNHVEPALNALANSPIGKMLF